MSLTERDSAASNSAAVRKKQLDDGGSNGVQMQFLPEKKSLKHSN
jgi:hypothetical protein